MELTTISNFPASILGLAGERSMDVDCAKNAFAAGINYFFFYNLAYENLLDGVKLLGKDKREDILIATGSESRDEHELNKYLEQFRDRLNIDCVDVFFLEYVSPNDDLDRVYKLLDRLYLWKEKEAIRYVGVTVHNRAIALKLIENKRFDVLMHRYNMAHRKAELDVLPAARDAEIPVIAFTCTRWGSLLKGHPDWQKKIPTAADCYRYALQDRSVKIALTAPKTLAQLAENLQVLKNPNMSQTERSMWQEYGDLIYGDGKDTFETEWA